MHQDTTAATSRRTFVKCGLLSAGVFVGSASTGAVGDSGDDRDDAASAQSLEAGVMRSYQCIAGQQVTVDEAVEWQPAGLEGGYRSYVVSYDHAPSYQAFLFVPESGPDDGGEPSGSGSGSAPLQTGDALSLGAVQGSPAESGAKHVTVALESHRA